MKIATTPQMITKEIGKRFKVLHVTGEEGMSMPEHFSSKEAVLIIHKGSAVLTMNGKDYRLNRHDSMIIPGREAHTLNIHADFEADVIMECDSEIQFIN